VHGQELLLQRGATFAGLDGKGTPPALFGLPLPSFGRL
jgi:hypothetical protein